MRKWFWKKAAIALFGPALFLFAGNALAASLAKIEVASHLGESFYAEVPVKLEPSETVSRVLVEIASAADYKIFEVYRDPVLKGIRADVASDERGVRVELSSSSRIKAPFFNLILKIHSGRVSHFKKFPVFLDVEKSVQQVARQKPQPSVQPVKTDPAVISSGMPLTESAGQIISSGEGKSAPDTAQSTDKYDNDWARTDRYGPIVRGDSLSTVAKRLMIDDRYSLSQVRLALFEKNRSSFAQENMNLLKKNSFLDVPTPDEVEQHSRAEASLAFLEHEKKWHQLIKQPRYAAEAEAQRTRYTKHISVGEHADGVASAPAVISQAAAVAKSEPPVQPTIAMPSSGSANKAINTEIVGQVERVTQAQNENSHLVAELQERNELLQQQLVVNQESIEALKQKVANVTVSGTSTRMDKLEILITRLQTELEEAHARQSASLFAGMDWIIWLLIGLLVVLLGTVALLLRREPAHPAESTPVPDELAVGDENGGEAVVMNSLSASASEFGKTDETGSTFTDEDSGNLSIPDFDISDDSTGQESNDQKFDVQDFNEPEELNWLNDASFDDEETDSPGMERGESTVPGDDSEPDGITDFAAGGESDDLLLEFEIQDDEKPAVEDEEEPTRHLDSLLSKFEDDDPEVTDEVAFGQENSSFESSDDEDISISKDMFIIDNDLDQDETEESAHQADELSDDEDHKKD